MPELEGSKTAAKGPVVDSEEVTVSVEGRDTLGHTHPVPVPKGSPARDRGAQELKENQSTFPRVHTCVRVCTRPAHTRTERRDAHLRARPSDDKSDGPRRQLKGPKNQPKTHRSPS